MTFSLEHLPFGEGFSAAEELKDTDFYPELWC